MRVGDFRHLILSFRQGTWSQVTRPSFAMEKQQNCLQHPHSKSSYTPHRGYCGSPSKHGRKLASEGLD